MKHEKFYSSKEIADKLSIQPVTVRKYSQLLEDKGYVFNRDDKGWRKYTENDLQALKHLVNLKLDGKSVEESVEVVANLYHSNLSVLPIDITLQGEDPLKDFMEKQMEFNKKVLDRLDQQEQRQAERDQSLMLVMNEILESKKQIATSQEKGWWHKLRFWK